MSLELELPKAHVRELQIIYHVFSLHQIICAHEQFSPKNVQNGTIHTILSLITFLEQHKKVLFLHVYVPRSIY
jgi:hypothetical protein